MIYNGFKKKILDGEINLATDTIKVMLVTSTYVPNIDTHLFKSDVTNEVVGTGYTAGGATITNPVVSQDNTDNEGVYDADDISWPASTITARGAVIYKDTGVASTSPLIAYIDFGADKSTSNGILTIQFNAEGILNLN